MFPLLYTLKSGKPVTAYISTFQYDMRKEEDTDIEI